MSKTVSSHLNLNQTLPLTLSTLAGRGTDSAVFWSQFITGCVSTLKTCWQSWVLHKQWRFWYVCPASLHVNHLTHNKETIYCNTCQPKCKISCRVLRYLLETWDFLLEESDLQLRDTWLLQDGFLFSIFYLWIDHSLRQRRFLTLYISASWICRHSLVTTVNSDNLLIKWNHAIFILSLAEKLQPCLHKVAQDIQVVWSQKNLC